MCKLCVDAVKEIFPNVPEDEIHGFLTACTCFGFGSPEEVKNDLLMLRSETEDYHDCYGIVEELVEEAFDPKPTKEKEKRKPIGKVIATVEFPLYEGDKTEGSFSWFEYREPGITSGGQLGTCVRACTTINSKVVLD